MIVTYASGRWIEIRHFLSIEKREAACNHQPVLNVEEDIYVSGAHHTELVSASVAIGADYFRSFLCDLLSMFGRILFNMENLTDRARREAILRMKEQAPKASYFTGLRLDVAKESRGKVMAVCFATAVYNSSSHDAKPIGYPEPLNHSLNQSRKNPLLHLLVYGGAALLLVIGIYSGGGYVIDRNVQYFPVSYEKKLWDLMGDEENLFKTHALTPELQVIEKQLQALVDKMPKDGSLAGRQFKVMLIDDETVNALSLPGDKIIVFKGLLDELGSENALVFVLGHELGHFAHRDHMKQLARQIVAQILDFIMGSNSSSYHTLGSAISNMEIHFSREQELAADSTGLDMLVAMYGHAGGATDYFAWSAQRSDYKKKQRSKAKNLLDRILGGTSDHPDDTSRVNYLSDITAAKGYKVKPVTLLPWLDFQPEATSVSALLARYNYDEIRDLNYEKMRPRYYNAYQQFTTLFVDNRFLASVSPEADVKYYIAQTREAERLNKLYAPYWKATWAAWRDRYKDCCGDHSKEMREKANAIIDLIDEQLGSDLAVLKAHRNILLFLDENAGKWKPGKNPQFMFNYTGASAAFQERNQILLAAYATRNRLWEKRDRAEKEWMKDFKRYRQRNNR